MHLYYQLYFRNKAGAYDSIDFCSQSQIKVIEEMLRRVESEQKHEAIFTNKKTALHAYADEGVNKLVLCLYRLDRQNTVVCTYAVDIHPTV